MNQQITTTRIKPLGAALALALAAGAASADVTVTVLQVGSDVVWTASGSADVSGLTSNGSLPSSVPFCLPDTGFQIGAAGAVDVYRLVGANFAGPGSFGSGPAFSTGSATGGLSGLDFVNELLVVPGGYASGDPLSSTATYIDATLASLGLTEGEYIWTWDTATGTETLTLQIGPQLVTNTTQGTQHVTLQSALDNATSGDAIAIAAGTLFEDNIVFPAGLDVTVTGAGMDQTFIDGGSDDSDIVVRIEGGQTSSTVLQSLSLTNQGAAAMKIGTATPEVRFVRFLNCSGNSALDIRDSALIDRCVFTGMSNAFENLYARTGSPVLLQCLFYSNDTFVDITRDSGPGSMRVVSCTLEGGNNAVFDGRPGGAIEISNSVLGTSLELDVPGTTTVSHSLYPGAPASNGNIDGVPTFIDAANGDYRLVPGSLGVDAADADAFMNAGGSLLDLAGADRYVDDAAITDTGVGVLPTLDMGAYEFQGQPSTGCPADQNFDGMLSPADFNAWIFNYNAGCP